MIALGAVQPISICPHCSVLVDGHCVPCAAGEKHPSCKYCKDGDYSPPLHQHPWTQAVVTAVIVSVVSGLIIRRLVKH